MQSSFRIRGRDIGFHEQKPTIDDLCASKPMGMSSSESFQANGHDNESNNYELSPRESSSAMTKKTLPANGKKTKGRVKIKMEFIDNKLRRYTTFSKRKTGIMKKAYELSTLTGTQVMLLVASETGHVYTFATRKLQPMITSESGKALIQTCLNSPDPTPGPGASGLDQRMSATGFEETDLTYSVAEDCEKMSEGNGKSMYSSELSPTSVGATIFTPSLVSFAPSLPVSNSNHRSAGSKTTSVTTSSSSNTASPHLVSTTNTPSLTNPSFATILTASAAGGDSPTVRIGAFPTPDSPNSPDRHRASPQQQTVYGLPTGQSFSLTLAGGSKQQGISASSESSSSQNSMSVVQGSTQNVPVLSGNVVIPQTILQANSSAFVYHTDQGLVYATPKGQGLVYAAPNLPEGMVLNLGQEQGTQQQFITIPVSLSLTTAPQPQGTQATSQTSSYSNRREKSRK